MFLLGVLRFYWVFQGFIGFLIGFPAVFDRLLVGLPPSNTRSNWDWPKRTNKNQ